MEGSGRIMHCSYGLTSLYRKLIPKCHNISFAKYEIRFYHVEIIARETELFYFKGNGRQAR